MVNLVEINLSDADFIFQLVNQKSFKTHIGDKKIKTLDDAKAHIKTSYIASYKKYNFGMWGIKDAKTGVLVGVCGLVQRPEFDTPDLGYALLDEHVKKGYIAEAASKTLIYAKENANISRINAMTSTDNTQSINVLTRLGFTFIKQVELNGYKGTSNLYQKTL